MKAKIIILLCATLALVGSLLLFIYSSEKVKAPSTSIVEHKGMKIRQVGEALYKQYDNLKDLEYEADLIIIGQTANDLTTLKQSRKNTTNYDPIGEFWVDTPFKVKKVLKGNYLEKEIIIAQPLIIDENQKQVLTLPGYSPLLENAEYILFLAKSEYGVQEGQEYAWNIISFNHGKYNLDGIDNIEDSFSDEKQNKMKKLVKRKYVVEN